MLPLYWNPRRSCRRALAANAGVEEYPEGKQTPLRLLMTLFKDMTITAAKLIAKQKSQGSGVPLIVRDLSDPDRPVRLISFAAGRSNPAVIVRSVGVRPAFLERIELLEQDADTRLARYLVPNMSALSDVEV